MGNAPTTAGLEQLKGLLKQGEEQGLGIAGLIGIKAEVLEPGRVVFSLVPQAAFSNPLGIVHGGIMSTLLDSSMGCAVHASLPEGALYTTLELKVNFIRPVPLDGGRLLCEGTTIHVGRKAATAEGRVTNADGKLVAHGTTTCMVFSPVTNE
ncbi:PaaI family thioesterase [Actinomadura rubrisoli]|uniref:PaaI family thioesterase n=1 Tax=Actinomadura rubrisoli TaxID=2530368 RepID=A0A4R5BW29_9ACTN|nr:PaaI family thioesterase [Actinomadura rubrisoli]TDD89570.1 PaaI family thioesterase [Actinomadura rubrisoli]